MEMAKDQASIFCFRRFLKFVLVVTLASPMLLSNNMAGAKSTMPAVGGYSTIFHNVESETTTVGIVTKIDGRSYCKGAVMFPGHGLHAKETVWVEPKARLHIVDTKGNEFVASGPTVFQLNSPGVIQILKGAVQLQSAEYNDASKISSPSEIKFISTYVAGSVKGEADLWVSKEMAQVFNSSGVTTAWHPQLFAGKVNVEVGRFVESAKHFKFLQPKKQQYSTPEDMIQFFSRFMTPANAKQKLQAVLAQAAPVKKVKPTEEEAIASAEKQLKEPAIGSRFPAEVLEKEDPEAIERMAQKAKGLDWDDGSDDQAALAVAGKDKGRGLASKRARRNQRKGPRFDIDRVGDGLSEKQLKLIESLMRQGGR